MLIARGLFCPTHLVHRQRPRRPRLPRPLRPHRPRRLWHRRHITTRRRRRPALPASGRVCHRWSGLAWVSERAPGCWGRRRLCGCDGGGRLLLCATPRTGSQRATLDAPNCDAGVVAGGILGKVMEFVKGGPQKLQEVWGRGRGQRRVKTDECPGAGAVPAAPWIAAAVHTPAKPAAPLPS